MKAYWLAFAGFFFGLTYGLLQVVTDVPVLRREHQSGVSDAAYLASKVALLAPLLVLDNTVMLAVLRVCDRLPAPRRAQLGTARLGSARFTCSVEIRVRALDELVSRVIGCQLGEPHRDRSGLAGT